MRAAAPSVNIVSSVIQLSHIAWGAILPLILTMIHAKHMQYSQLTPLIVQIVPVYNNTYIQSCTH